MAGEKTQAELDAQIDAGIRVNGNREITPPIHNAIEKAIVNSSLNKKEGGVLQAIAFYSSAFPLTDPLSLVYLGYLDDNFYDSTEIDALLGDYLTQGTNTLTEDLFITGLFDIALGTDTKEPDTKVTFKSKGDDETTFLFQMLNNNDDLLLALQDDGNLVLPGSIEVGVYGSISETISGLAYIIGNSVMASKATANKLVKTTNDDGIAVRMRYDQGFSVHTGISGVAGTEVDDDTNMRLQVNQAGDLFLLMGSYHMASSEWMYVGGAAFATVDGLRLGQSGNDVVIQKNDSILGWTNVSTLYTP